MTFKKGQFKKGNNYCALRKNIPTYTQDQLKELAEDLLNYAENEKSIHLAPWCRKKNKCASWIYKLADNYEIIENALEMARGILAAKILNKSFYGEGNATVGMTYLPIYDTDFKNFLKWKAEINKEKFIKEENKGVFNEWIKTQRN